MIATDHGAGRSVRPVNPGLNDPRIRASLREHLDAQHSGKPDTVIIDELGICQGRTRVDVAVVNGLLHGYEIKSDHDSLLRLAEQAVRYGKVFDRATLVIGTRHEVTAPSLVPDWWAVMRVAVHAGKLRFRTLRRGRKNPAQDPRALVELLWLSDAIELLEQRNAARGLRGKPRRLVWDRICEELSPAEISAEVRKQLKARSARRGTRPRS